MRRNFRKLGLVWGRRGESPPPDPRAEGMPIVLARVDRAGLTTVMSNSFGFGGTNATLVFRRLR